MKVRWKQTPLPPCPLLLLLVWCSWCLFLGSLRHDFMRIMLECFFLFRRRCPKYFPKGKLEEEEEQQVVCVWSPCFVMYDSFHWHVPLYFFLLLLLLLLFLLLLSQLYTWRMHYACTPADESARWHKHAHPWRNSFVSLSRSHSQHNNDAACVREKNIYQKPILFLLCCFFFSSVSSFAFGSHALILHVTKPCKIFFIFFLLLFFFFSRSGTRHFGQILKQEILLVSCWNVVCLVPWC